MRTTRHQHFQMPYPPLQYLIKTALAYTNNFPERIAKYKNIPEYSMHTPHDKHNTIAISVTYKKCPRAYREPNTLKCINNQYILLEPKTSRYF